VERSTHYFIGDFMGCLVCALINFLLPESEEAKQELIEELRNDLEQYHPKKEWKPYYG